MRTLKKIWLGLVAGILGLSLGGPLHANANKYTVKIGPDTAFKEFLHIRHYYKTTKKTKVTAMVVPIYTTGNGATLTYTLPKGTVIAAERTTKYAPYQIDSSQLSYRLIKPLIKQGYAPTGQETDTLAAKTKLKRVKRPAFLPTYSYGDLYPGRSVQKITTMENFQAKQLIRLTSNGYLERHQAVKKAQPRTQLTLKPKASVKIRKTRVKGNTRYLYFKNKVSGVKTKHLRQGPYRYRLALKNRHLPVHLFGDSDNDVAGAYYSIYSLGGKTYFTPLGDDGSGD